MVDRDLLFTYGPSRWGLPSRR
ncbi:MAG: hypothetical protein QOI50_871, partial [Pseudonocardiales bacterium]|nr:hypothetical protein [Pseudonocardiales bacterium]